ncbi:response regulator [Ideonella livida]|uniref:Response regulator n=1 Tax=Ideonella livida TaxID=2707176 RepID=A0A7C9THH2_9BURK|nr:response regulator [Ideonella livida]NDY90480.1 response regulator [Ideonella livida]
MALILVVDDSSTMRRSLQMSLELSGYRVVTAPDGQAALELLQQGLRPDLMLTDIVMPRLDGLKLIPQARQILRFTPIIALTTQGQRAQREQARQAGATAWLVKPVGGTELAQLLRNYLPVGAAPATSATGASPEGG